jgi:hypothetical protein
MKKSLIILAILFMFTGVASAQERIVQRSGSKTADATVVSGVGDFHGIMVVTDGTNTCTVAIAGTGGTALMPTVIVPAAASYGMAYSFSPPIIYRDDVVVDITTSGTCTYDVYYTPR